MIYYFLKKYILQKEYFCLSQKVTFCTRNFCTRRERKKEGRRRGGGKERERERERE